MKKLSMSDITADHPSKLSAKIFIPGGWQAYVGEVALDAKTLDVYSRYLHSRREAAAVAQRVYESGFLVGLRACIKRRAQEYAERFPDLVHEEKKFRTTRKIYLLDGFDPEKVQALYVPFDNTGRPGKPFAQDILFEMARDARHAKDAA